MLPSASASARSSFYFIVMFDGKKVLDAHHAEFKSGAIGLQRTGQDIEFRNVKIKPL